jgi:two-component system, LytTR family, sensor kinase
MLRFQINPHFLFNALNSIRASIDEDKARARKMITQLSEFLRYSLLDGNECMTSGLGREIEAVQGYLLIEKVRFEDRLDVRFEIDPAAHDCEVPRFILTPLVENAVKHGMRNNGQALQIRLSVQRLDAHVRIEVSNNRGWVENSSPGEEGAGIGLTNLKQRLAGIYGEAGRLDIQGSDTMVCVTLDLPVAVPELCPRI